MPSVKVRDSLLEKALRFLKKKVDREGIMKVLKEKQFHDKPSKKSRAKSKAAKRYKVRKR